ncbi:MAG: hypothetical protein JO199_09970 [Candidatus Eremiobacteraeota bacterium]|nr:hypothetical protein [Candidatus Eremiobacteraeota bacterium]
MHSSDAHPNNARPDRHSDEGRVTRTLVWVGVGIGVAGLGAAIAYTIVRTVLGSRRGPDDPTSQRIQQLIDEANTLLKTLDEQRSSA